MDGKRPGGSGFLNRFEEITGVERWERVRKEG
jgi:hypothetical protein